MRIALVLVVEGVARTEEARGVIAEQVRYHLEQGVDVVVGVADEEDGALFAGLGEERRFRYTVARAPGAPEDSERARRIAVEQHAADWLLECGPGELWWARRGTLRELLDSVPARFERVRALEREFAPAPDGEALFERTMVRRRSLLSPARLRHAYRAGCDRAAARESRLWYPLELLRFPLGGEPIGDRALAAGLGDGSLRVDARVRGALRGQAVAPPTPADEIELAEELEALLAAPEEMPLFPAVDDLDRRLAALEQARALAPGRMLRSRFRRPG